MVFAILKRSIDIQCFNSGIAIRFDFFYVYLIPTLCQIAVILSEIFKNQIGSPYDFTQKLCVVPIELTQLKRNLIS